MNQKEPARIVQRVDDDVRQTRARGYKGSNISDPLPARDFRIGGDDTDRGQTFKPTRYPKSAFWVTAKELT